MYTLRRFKNVGSIEHSHEYIGDSYSIASPNKKQKEQGIVLVIICNYLDFKIPIFGDEFAYIITNNGDKFETLNEPKEITLMFLDDYIDSKFEVKKNAKQNEEEYWSCGCEYSQEEKEKSLKGFGFLHINCKNKNEE